MKELNKGHASCFSVKNKTTYAICNNFAYTKRLSNAKLYFVLQRKPKLNCGMFNLVSTNCKIEFRELDLFDLNSENKLRFLPMFRQIFIEINHRQKLVVV